jgi:hypothetical protein
MASSDRNRLSILLVFFILILVFAIAYHPTSAVSLPASRSTASGMPVQK